MSGGGVVGLVWAGVVALGWVLGADFGVRAGVVAAAGARWSGVKSGNRW